MSKTSTAPKGNKNTEVIIGKAAQRLEAATKSLAEAVNAAKDLEQQIADNTVKAVAIEDKIKDLEVSYSQNKAEMQFQLNLDYKTDRKKFVDSFLAENNLTVVPTDQLNNMQEELETTKRDFNSKLNAEIGKVRGMMEADYQQKAKINALEYEAKQAAATAELTQKENTIKSLTDQVSMWKGALDAERQAGIERAKAGAIGSINLGGPSR